MTVLILRKLLADLEDLAGFLMQRSWTDGGALGVFGSAQDAIYLTKIGIRHNDQSIRI
jgi:hypothetical protein